MFSQRRSRQVEDASYTGVSGIPGNRASSNAHAAASAIATALKKSNGSAVNMQVPPTQSKTLPRNSSIKDVSSEISMSGVTTTRRQPPRLRASVQAPVRKKTIKKYIPTVNGLVAVEVAVEDEEQTRLDAIQRTSRNSSLRGPPRKPMSRPLSRASSLRDTQSYAKQQQRAKYNVITEELKPTELETVQSVRERLQKEKELLEQQYKAKIEEAEIFENKLELEKLEKEKLELEALELEKKRQDLEKLELERLELIRLEEEKIALEKIELLRLQKQYEEELQLQKEIELEKERVLKEQEAAALEESRILDEQLAESDKTITEPEFVDQFVEEPDMSINEPVEIKSVESIVSEVGVSDNEQEEILKPEIDVLDYTNNSSSTELDVVHNYGKYSNDSFNFQNNNSLSAPTSGEMSEAFGTSTTEITVADDYPKDNSNHMSLAKHLRPTIQLPTFHVKEDSTPITNVESPPKQLDIPPRSERRLSMSSGSNGATLTRKKSALKQHSKYDVAARAMDNGTSPLAQVYLSLTTAENTRLNALNTLSNLSLNHTDHHHKKVIHQPSKNFAKPVKQSTPKRMSKIDGSYTKLRPVTINVPQQVSPGKFVLPKSDVKKKADELYKRANSKPRQKEDDLYKHLPPIDRRSSFEKARDAQQQQQPQQPQQPQQKRFTLRQPQGEFNENELPPQGYEPQHRSNGAGFKSRFMDSDSDDGMPEPVRVPRKSRGGERFMSSQSKKSNGTQLDDEKVKKKFGGKLKKLFGRN